jgi:hypothetical protein
LDSDDIQRLLGLIKSAKTLSKQDAEFQYLILEDSDGRWLSVDDVTQEIGDRKNDVKEDEVLPVGPINTASSDSRHQDLFIKPDGVFWSCNAGAGDADWMVDSITISEIGLLKILATFEQPPVIFK